MKNSEIMVLEGDLNLIEMLKVLDPRSQTRLLTSTMDATIRKVATDNVVRPIKSALPYSAETESHIGVFGGKRNYSVREFFAGPGAKIYKVRFADKGTKERVAKKTGRSYGKIVGPNRITPIVEGSVQNIVNQFNEQYGNKIAKTLENQNKKLKKNFGI